MGPDLLVIDGVGLEDATQAHLAEDDRMIETIAPN